MVTILLSWLARFDNSKRRRQMLHLATVFSLPNWLLNHFA
jgi:hypothetical protein